MILRSITRARSFDTLYETVMHKNHRQSHELPQLEAGMHKHLHVFFDHVLATAYAALCGCSPKTAGASKDGTNDTTLPDALGAEKTRNLKRRYAAARSHTYGRWELVDILGAQIVEHDASSNSSVTGSAADGNLRPLYSLPLFQNLELGTVYENCSPVYQEALRSRLLAFYTRYELTAVIRGNENCLGPIVMPLVREIQDQKSTLDDVVKRLASGGMDQCHGLMAMFEDPGACRKINETVRLLTTYGSAPGTHARTVGKP